MGDYHFTISVESFYNHNYSLKILAFPILIQHDVPKLNFSWPITHSWSMAWVIDQPWVIDSTEIQSPMVDPWMIEI